MINDIFTMIWKESLEYSNQSRNSREKITGMIFPFLSLGLLAIVPPLSLGSDWIRSPFSLVISILVPLITVTISIPLSLIGERERKTLETLFASRLPDRAILFGTIFPPIFRASKISFFVHLVSLVTYNIAQWSGHLSIYPFEMLFANLVTIILLSFSAASLGVLISLKTTSLRQAMNYLNAILMAPVMIFGITIYLIGNVFPDPWRLAFENWFEKEIMTANFEQVFSKISLVLFLITLILMFLVLLRFKRSLVKPDCV